ncbi:hypothetical protein LguiA_027123 [Lonicera macranthoides]
MLSIDENRNRQMALCPTKSIYIHDDRRICQFQFRSLCQLFVSPTNSTFILVCISFFLQLIQHLSYFPISFVVFPINSAFILFS